jgi:imidazolonepropionase-like amidohydrolase
VRLVSGVDSGIAPAKRHGVLPQAVCELVSAGLNPAEAPRTATAYGAEVRGVRDRKGRLAAGHHADPLMVNGDLETDITALLRPQSVLLHGRPANG